MTMLTQMTENASRSTYGRRLHRFVPSRLGNMSIRLSTRYTVVPRDAASASIGLSGCTKWDTSAMSEKDSDQVPDPFPNFNEANSRTPASMLPLGNRFA